MKTIKSEEERKMKKERGEDAENGGKKTRRIKRQKSKSAKEKKKKKTQAEGATRNKIQKHKTDGIESSAIVLSQTGRHTLTRTPHHNHRRAKNVLFLHVR